VQESRELCLEEVKSRETDRPATSDEARAVAEADAALLGNADALLGNAHDDARAEVVVEKDVLVEEFTRSETTHEQKVSQSTVHGSLFLHWVTSTLFDLTFAEPIR